MFVTFTDSENDSNTIGNKIDKFLQNIEKNNKEEDSGLILISIR